MKKKIAAKAAAVILAGMMAFEVVPSVFAGDGGNEAGADVSSAEIVTEDAEEAVSGDSPEATATEVIDPANGTDGTASDSTTPDSPSQAGTTPESPSQAGTTLDSPSQAGTTPDSSLRAGTTADGEAVSGETSDDESLNAEVNPSDISLSLTTKDGQAESDGAIALTTGSQLTFYSGLKLTGSETLTGAYLDVAVPHQYLTEKWNGNNDYLNVSGGESLTGDPEILYNHDGLDTVTARFHYTNLSGGASVELPIILKTKNRTTPPDSTIPVKATLYSQDGEILKTATMTIRNKAKIYYATVGENRYQRAAFFQDDTTPTDESDSRTNCSVLPSFLLDTKPMSDTGVYVPPLVKSIFVCKLPLGNIA